MRSEQLRDLIIRPVLKYLGMWSLEAEDLVLGTACAESLCGDYIRQVTSNGYGPAMGIYQMEMNTCKDIYANFLSYKKDLLEKVNKLLIPTLSYEQNLVSNLMFATAMCRIHYYRVKEAIPKTLIGQAEYWKKYYNTEKGAGTVAGYIDKVNKLK